MPVVQISMISIPDVGFDGWNLALLYGLAPGYLG